VRIVSSHLNYTPHSVQSPAVKGDKEGRMDLRKDFPKLHLWKTEVEEPDLPPAEMQFTCSD
jgi:hypothetical protein